MLTHVDAESAVPVYEQIKNEVRFAIASGRLRSGDRLPSVRELSDRLGVNANTVSKGYRDLEVMGLLYTRRGMGVFVNKGVEARCREEIRRAVIDRLHEVVVEARSAGITGKELLNIAKACSASTTAPYEDAPAAITGLAKPGRRTRRS